MSVLDISTNTSIMPISNDFGPGVSHVMNLEKVAADLEYGLSTPLDIGIPIEP